MLAAIPRALAGRELTREELAAAVAAEVGKPALAAKLGCTAKAEQAHGRKKVT